MFVSASVVDDGMLTDLPNDVWYVLTTTAATYKSVFVVHGFQFNHIFPQTGTCAYQHAIGVAIRQST
jgi:hypothetical protein